MSQTLQVNDLVVRLRGSGEERHRDHASWNGKRYRGSVDYDRRYRGVLPALRPDRLSHYACKGTAGQGREPTSIGDEYSIIQVVPLPPANPVGCLEFDCDARYLESGVAHDTSSFRLDRALCAARAASCSSTSGDKRQLRRRVPAAPQRFARTP